MALLTRESVPRLYAILDAEALAARGLEVAAAAGELRSAGIRLLQYRDKISNEVVILRNAEVLRRVFEGSGALLILNDSPELARQAEWDGVHVGQGDSPVARARELLGAGRIVGVSTHTVTQVSEADRGSADYVAFGPIFATASKQDTEAVVGLDGLAEARLRTRKPLIAIGGIGGSRARQALDHGADSVAAIGAVLDGLAELQAALLTEL